MAILPSWFIFASRHVVHNFHAFLLFQICLLESSILKQFLFSWKANSFCFIWSIDMLVLGIPVSVWLYIFSHYNIYFSSLLSEPILYMYWTLSFYHPCLFIFHLCLHSFYIIFEFYFLSLCFCCILFSYISSS